MTQKPIKTIILVKPDGSKREVEEGKSYKLQLGEVPFSGSRDVERDEENKRLEMIAKNKGIGVGDLVHKLTNILGIPHCAKCQERKLVMNKLRLNGWKIDWDKEGI